MEADGERIAREIHRNAHRPKGARADVARPQTDEGLFLPGALLAGLALALLFNTFFGLIPG
jgi:hypothetical protein